MAKPQNIQVPYSDRIVSATGLLTNVWVQFFKLLKDIIDPLGIEKSFLLLNDQSVAVKINGLRFNTRQIASFCDYAIQRITSTDEYLEAGTFKVVYRSDSQAFDYVADPNAGPDSSGVTLSINTDGEMFYTSTNNAGNQQTFKLSVRQRYLTGGNQQ